MRTPSWPTCSVASCLRSSKSLTPTTIPLRVPAIGEREEYVLKVDAYFCAMHSDPAEVAIAYDEFTHSIADERTDEVAAPLLEASS